ncbi:flagellar protein FliT [Halomonas sp. V046]|uniref:flagellar protein FliT n=1 Tax=Halomonas sp. V046 TaxID=3459611 RepID=UPI00404500A3
MSRHDEQLVASQQISLIQSYESLLGRTRQMLDLADAAEWEALIGQESDYVIAVGQLEQTLPMDDLDAPSQRRLGELLEQILDNDLAIRQRLVERRDALGGLIQASRRQRDLNRVYAGGQVVNAASRFGQDSA